jgi:CRISPR-associated endonuclease Csn1
MKNILGLDLGVNSIGWALVDAENHKIIKAGSRILPMDASAVSDFDNGTLQSAASVRRTFRSMRRINQRAQLRRERLLRVLNIMDFLPEHYRDQIDFDVHPGKFLQSGEPLLPYRQNADGKRVFIFMDSFREMLADFAQHHPSLVEGGRKVPYDWTIYYLRKKALTQPISQQELAWILLNFNTKRGYYQLRGDEALVTNENEAYAVLQVVDVEDKGPDPKKKSFHLFEITYDNGAKKMRSCLEQPCRVSDSVESIVTTTVKKDGTTRVTVKEPEEKDWTLMKKRTEKIIADSHKTVGSYIYDNLLVHPDVKVRGKLVHTIERDFYKEELRQILATQKRFLPELTDKSLLDKCVGELYHHNEGHRNLLLQQDLGHMLLEDIIFYQRPLKSKKSLIANCPFEARCYKDENDQKKIRPLKCIAKSNPYFQEFRLWQFVQNLRIYERERSVDGRVRLDVDVTAEFIRSDEDLASLFEWLNERDMVTQDQLLKSPLFGLGKRAAQYRWNYEDDAKKKKPCNETRFAIAKCLKEVSGNPVLTRELEQELWHLLYSVDDLVELRKALQTFAEKKGFDVDSFVAAFLQMKPFESSYGSFSEKAIRRLLPLMRCGKYWSEAEIDGETRLRIEKIVDGEVDEKISERTREKAIRLSGVESCRNLPLWLASYIVYDRHSESSDVTKWESPEDIDRFLLTEFKQNSLRNPTVEAVLGETLRVVRDIWRTYGEISEVHVEMGRNLKQPKDKRERDNRQRQQNENINFRIRALLQEFVSPEYNISNVRPNSPSQQDLLKIYEDYALSNMTAEDSESIQVIADALANPSKHVSKQEIMKYRLWLDQKYLSPYTGQPIPLSKLFTPAYEIEHVIPKSRYYDDSLKNKVICESEVNKDKGNMLAYEYILKRGSAIVAGAGGKQFRILDKDEYVSFVNQHFHGPRKKQLLLEDIPDDFIQRQLNDTRYIARKTIELLSHLVREKEEREATSKNVIPTNGAITDLLKKNWGINDVWNDLVAPRFERLNKLTGSTEFGQWVNVMGKRYFQCSVPLALSKGYSKKRIDHRHHAMDAIVIALASRDMVNFLSNQSASKEGESSRYDLRAKLCERIETDSFGNYVWVFKKPWPTLTQDVHAALSSLIVSFKQNLRVVNKSSNHYWHYENGKKVRALQTKGDGWAIRKSLHRATVSGPVRLQTKKKEKLLEALGHIHLIVDKDVRQAIRDVQKIYQGKADEKTILKYFKDRGYRVGEKDIRSVEVWFTPQTAEHIASRVAIGGDMDRKTIESQIADSGISRILSRHLDRYIDAEGKDHPELAFSPEGIARMNEDIQMLNGGAPHKPIYKVRRFETAGIKFTVGSQGAKKRKFVEADKGTNLFFSVYADRDGNRNFKGTPFNEAVECMKAGLPIANPVDEEGRHLLFTLSPLDLVYMPDENEDVELLDLQSSSLDIRKIYKFVSYTSSRAYFVPCNLAKSIADKVEFNKLNKIELDDHKRSIKQYCVKIQVDRLGNRM